VYILLLLLLCYRYKIRRVKREENLTDFEMAKRIACKFSRNVTLTVLFRIYMLYSAVSNVLSDTRPNIQSLLFVDRSQNEASSQLNVQLQVHVYVQMLNQNSLYMHSTTG
jgi:hypothetical protein